jgi:acyl-CoA synthetase (NDP forming)/GNAT superfamily N-acetyltransferase
MTMLEIDCGGADSVRSDGGLVRIRTIAETDLDSLRALHARASDRSVYLRFFTLSRDTADEYVEKLIEPGGGARHALVACIRGEIIGVAAFEAVNDTAAEFALLIADEWQHEGIGTLLLEHLASVARHNGIHRFVADVLAENAAMLRVLRDLGFETHLTLDDQTIRVVFDIMPADHLVAVVGERERSADAASLRPLLAPRSVVVVGASERPGSVGHQVLVNILGGGFTGTVLAVNPHRTSVLGVPCVASPADLAEAPDLAVVAVPAPAVPGVVRACGERGVRAVLLLTAGFGELGSSGRSLQNEVVAIAREYGMRLVGPNCVGVVNTDPEVRLDATFAELPTKPGVLGLVSQSGAFGIAFLAAAARRGMHVSQFVSVGNKADVSGNDLLMAWEHDPRTKVIGMYLESIGNARKFVRIARRVAASKPIVVIKAGRSTAGQRAGQSHTAAAASSDIAVDAMFAEAGALRVSTVQEMLDAAWVLAEQPLPAGPRVAIIGNSGGPGILAADAVSGAGLQVVELPPATQDLVRQAVPHAASTQNPIDLGAAAQPDEVGAAVRAVLAAADVDAVLTVFTEVAVVDAAATLAGVVAAAETSDKPLIATQVGGAERAVQMAAPGRSVPVFGFPEPAAAALGVAYRYAQLRTQQPASISRPDGIDQAPAREVVEAALASGAEWLGPDEVSRLLIHYGIPVCPQRVVSGADNAARAAAELGYPVALKVAGGVVHKTDVGGVRLGIRDEAELRAAVADITAIVAGATEVLIQPMAAAGTELIVGAVQDAQFGPMVMLGAGGVLADLVDDKAFRLAPLAAAGADEMIAGLRLSRLLDGYRGRPVVSRQAVRDVLMRVAALVDDLREVAELDLNPLVCTGDELIVVDARIRVSPPPAAQDPLVRQLGGQTQPRGSETA